MDTLQQLIDGKLAGATTLALKNANLTSLPLELAALASTLEHLDCSDNPRLAALPSATHFPWHTFTKLKRVFFASCAFKTFPAELALCPALSMVGFRSNAMRDIPHGALPPKLRWLILTGNELTTLPDDIGRCVGLEKCMLAGNAITHLPSSMSACTNLTLLRLACNKLGSVPSWLLEMPKLAFLAMGSNPCVRQIGAGQTSAPAVLTSELAMGDKLGEGASGIICKATWGGDKGKGGLEVAVKMFRSALITSDGSPRDEMTAALLAGAHPNLVSALARVIAPAPRNVSSDNDDEGEVEEEDMDTVGIIMTLLPASFTILGLPPTFDSCTRDAYPPQAALSAAQAFAVLRGIAAAMAHCHARGLTHGDLYAHNIAWDPALAQVVLGDFGAAYAYDRAQERQATLIERLEVRAFGLLVEDVLGLLGAGERQGAAGTLLGALRGECLKETVASRPSFAEIVQLLA